MSVFPTPNSMGTNEAPSTVICQACGQGIVGKVLQFGDDPRSAFCSIDCQISLTEPMVVEAVLAPRTATSPPMPVFAGPIATRLRGDRGCECGVFYRNQITVPKGHSVICICPKCGCVTVD